VTDDDADTVGAETPTPEADSSSSNKNEEEEEEEDCQILEQKITKSRVTFVR
jgi:hypothetical protein